MCLTKLRTSNNKMKTLQSNHVPPRTNNLVWLRGNAASSHPCRSSGSSYEEFPIQDGLVRSSRPTLPHPNPNISTSTTFRLPQHVTSRASLECSCSDLIPRYLQSSSLFPWSVTRAAPDPNMPVAAVDRKLIDSNSMRRATRSSAQTPGPLYLCPTRSVQPSIITSGCIMRGDLGDLRAQMPVPGGLGGSYSAKRSWPWVDSRLPSVRAPCDTPVTGAYQLIDGLPQRTDD